MNSPLHTLTDHGRTGAVAILRTAVNTVKPTAKAVVSMVGRHPEAVVGALAGYAVGAQLDRVWLLRHVTGRSAKYVGAFIGGMYGYQMALQRRHLDVREEQMVRPPD
jgi:hypothetical protein